MTHKLSGNMLFQFRSYIIYTRESTKLKGKGSQENYRRYNKGKSFNKLSEQWVAHAQLCSKTHQGAIDSSGKDGLCTLPDTHVLQYTLTFLSMIRVCVSLLAAGTWLSILSSCSVVLCCSDSMRDKIPVPVMKLDSTFRLFSVVFTFNISARAWGNMHTVWIHSSILSHLFSHESVIQFKWIRDDRTLVLNGAVVTYKCYRVIASGSYNTEPLHHSVLHQSLSVRL